MDKERLTKHGPTSVPEGRVVHSSAGGRRSMWRMAVAVVTALAVLAVPALAEADISAVNQQRAAAGLPPLVESGGLTSLAQQHSAYMATTANLTHSGNLGGTVGSVLPSYTGAAENVGQGPSVGTVTNLFMGSPTHRSAILGNFDTGGMGVAVSADGRVWVTQLFARTGGPAPPPSVQAGTPRSSVSRRSAKCRVQTRRSTRVIRGKRVTRVVRTKRCTKAKRKAVRKKVRHRAVRRR
jgi:hypothetical protein